MSKYLELFYESEREKLLIIEADYQQDKVHIGFIQFVIDKVEKETMELSRGKEKALILLIHMKRNYNEG